VGIDAAGARPGPAAPSQRRLPVLGVASEMFPLLKTGGLADVVGALPAALAEHGVELTTLLPGHPAVVAGLEGGQVRAQWPEWFGGPARVLSGRHRNAELLVLDAPHLYARHGNPYLDASGRDWSDNALRYAALALAAARVGWGEVDGLAPAVLHAHDWQAALVPVYQHYLGAGKRRAPTLMTLHNLAFQGQFGAAAWAQLRLPDAAFSTQGLEYHGDIGFLKGGLHFADAISTVSPSYAEEILTLAGGMGLDAMLRWRRERLHGIVNGLDTEAWDPARDPALAQTYDADTLERRAANRREIEARFGLPEAESPLLCMVSRLTTQKGIDLVAQALDAIVGAGARLVVLGAGEAAIESALASAAARHPQRVAVRIGYDESLAHLLHGGADAILVPSRFEPCGLTQLSGQRYGCVPVVARVGGLADTVIDANHAAIAAGVATGVQFGELSAEGVLGAVQRTLRLHRDRAAWRAMQRAGMRADLGWRASAGLYAALYRQLAQETS
jgi:starch synthase